MASNIPVIVQGNSFSLAIPLQIYYINGDQMDLQDYTPDPTDEVSVQLKGSRRNYTYTPTIDGNVANIDLSGNELADNYSVVVSIVKANGQRLRSFRTDQFFIVESSDDLTTDDIIQGLEENVIYLNTQCFVAGADGRGIESIVKTSTSGLVDTYTITYTDNTTSTFQVTNGANGQAGAQGVGITSIEKTGTSGLVDTYTITLSNGSTSTFEVTNGRDGHDLGLAVIVDDLTTGGHEDALSAEMGKVLAEMIGGEVTPTYEVEGNLMPFDGIVMGKKVTAITKASDNTINPTLTDAEGWAYVIVTLDRTQHVSYGMCGYNLAGESEGFGFFGIVYNPNNGAYYTGNINATIARNANIAAYENAKINAINPSQAAFNIHQIAINIPCSSAVMQQALTKKTLGLFSGSIVPKTTCSTMKESHNIFDSSIRIFSIVNYLNSNYIAVEPSTKYVMVGAAFVVLTYNASRTQTGTIYADQQPDYSELKNVYGAPYCTFTTGANDAYIRLNNQIGGTSGVTNAQWEKWQKLTIYKASLGYKPIAPHWVSKDYAPTTPKMYDLAFVGDSITFLGWYKQMFAKIAIKSHYANGTNSIAWTSSAMESKFQALINAYSNGDVVDDFGETITAPQAIFVFLGTNADAVAGDMATTMGMAIGNLSPQSDRTQAMRKFIYMLRDAFPNAKIVGLAPYNNYNQTTIAKMVEVANAVESNYQYLGVRCYNLSKISGIMPDFDTSSVHTYLSDGIHPNAAGIELLSGIGVKVIEAEV